MSGPLPPPETLAQYEQIQEGFAERIMRMAETQQNHRHGVQRELVQEESKKRAAGQYLGFIVTLTAMIGATVAVLLNPSWPMAIFASVMIGAPLAAIVIAFITGRGEAEVAIEDQRQPIDLADSHD